LLPLLPANPGKTVPSGNRRVRAAATRRKVSVNAFLIEALVLALGPRGVAESKEAR